MIHLKDMRDSVDQHLETLLAISDKELQKDLPNQIRMIVIHLERLHRNLAVHIETLG